MHIMAHELVEYFSFIFEDSEFPEILKSFYGSGEAMGPGSAFKIIQDFLHEIHCFFGAVQDIWRSLYLLEIEFLWKLLSSIIFRLWDEIFQN